MFDSVRGGGNTLIGGDNNGTGFVTSSGYGTVYNYIYGDAYQMFDSAQGGHNHLTSGNSSGGGTVFNYLYGDAFIESNTVRGGNNELIAGSQSGTGSMVVNYMWGSAPGLSVTQSGSNVFVFVGDLVGIQNFVEDFHQGQDKIELSDVSGVHNFGDLSITNNGSDTVITTLHDTVTLVGFSGTLTQYDFLIL